jgi:hypothetical protein
MPSNTAENRSTSTRFLYILFSGYTYMCDLYHKYLAFIFYLDVPVAVQSFQDAKGMIHESTGVSRG